MPLVTIPYREWIKDTSASGKLRSKELRAVDNAFRSYERNNGSKQSEWQLVRKFQAWQASKGMVGDQPGWKTNQRNHKGMIQALHAQLFPPNRVNENPNEMVEISALPEFPGFGIRYDPDLNPFFRSILLDNLAMLTRVRTGRTLLRVIAQASPIHRANFPLGVNVVCQPLGMAFTITQTGHKVVHGEAMLKSGADQHNPESTDSDRECAFYRSGKGSLNAAVDPSQSSQGGSVCVMTFTASQVLTSKGEISYPFIVLGHELIHSYHCLYGLHKGSNEEKWTTGIGQFSDEPMSENGLRREFKLPPREDY